MDDVTWEVNGISTWRRCHKDGRDLGYLYWDNVELCWVWYNSETEKFTSTKSMDLDTAKKYVVENLLKVQDTKTKPNSNTWEDVSWLYNSEDGTMFAKRSLYPARRRSLTTHRRNTGWALQTDDGRSYVLPSCQSKEELIAYVVNVVKNNIQDNLEFYADLTGRSLTATVDSNGKVTFK